MFEFLAFIQRHEINPLPSRNRLLADQLRGGSEDSRVEKLTDSCKGPQADAAQGDGPSCFCEPRGFDASRV